MAGNLAELIKAEIVDLKAKKERIKRESEREIAKIEARILQLQGLTIDANTETAYAVGRELER